MPGEWWALWYGLVYFVAIIGAWLLVTVVWLWLGLDLRRKTSTHPEPAKTEPPDLENDPALHRFFARVNRAYRRSPPAHVEAPLPGTSPLNRPRLLHKRGDPEIIKETTEPEPYSINSDPFVLHSAPFFSPREEQPPRPRSAPKSMEPPKAAPSPAPPAEPTEQDLITFVNIWAQLSERDRRELLALAKMKAGLDK